jgi:ribosomal protein S18 acetylase RimI-like enzyme
VGWPAASFAQVLSRSLGHVGAYDGARLIGFVSIAWDGGVHAFILDTCVHPDCRRQGIASSLSELSP